ncbi:MAG: hypothetical protein QOI17_1805, partial [Gaiellales bacterium]|nr:hypothetical protein [Gaiellales bacterium]
MTELPRIRPAGSDEIGECLALA